MIQIQIQNIDPDSDSDYDPGDSDDKIQISEEFDTESEESPTMIVNLAWKAMMYRHRKQCVV